MNACRPLVYRELNNAVAFNKAESGTAVLVDVNTAKCWRWPTAHRTNPNNMADTPKDTMRNRAITDIFEPGSTVKPMVVMTALQRGVVKENSVLNTIPYRVSGHEIKDVARYSELTVTGILQKSSKRRCFKAGVSDAVLSVSRYLLTFWAGKSDQFGAGRRKQWLIPKKTTVV
ncbi:Peptidoglycan synthase FtsI precursor [Serratia fonticola]|uniref:Peptidoglycan synthase FtsI n=1 Tax=Serratia fonticola TaxID=47917 RepID=A0A4U9U3N1_SERFO|nr:Peptidoglycan synthase FtsI precursor [Serratia fonticola]